MKTITLFLASILCFFFSNNCLFSQCNINDFNALYNLYHNTNGPNWFNTTGWDIFENNVTPPVDCNLSALFGVTLNFANGRVWELNLSTNNLDGELPSELESLRAIKEIYLAGNKIRGTIPPELSNINGLQILSLASCRLSGSLPVEIGDLPNLRILYLQNNILGSEIPEELGNLASIEILFLHNNFFDGSLPATLTNLASLQALNVSNNELNGCYHEELLDLCGNQSNANISDGNYFNFSWEDFCASGGFAGACPPLIVSNVWPGDVDFNGRVDGADNALFGGVLNKSGPARDSIGIEWYGHPALDWGEQFSGKNVDIKHADTDGNGVINLMDDDAVEINMGLTHGESPSSGPGIGIAPEIIYPDELAEYKILLYPIENINNDDDLLHVNVALESKIGEPLEINGGYFRIRYSNAVTNPVMLFHNTWLGSVDQNLAILSKDFPDKNEIDISFFRINGDNVSGSGFIGQLSFSIDFSALRSNDPQVEFDIFRLGFHDNNLSPLPVSNHILSVDFGESECLNENLSINTSTSFQNIYKSNGIVSTQGFLIVGKEQQVTYQGAERVTLNTNFSVRAGAIFRATTESCL